MDVSVVIVGYETRDLLLKCLRSLYASQGVSEPEVIVVDNASGDETVAALRAAFPMCTVIANSRNVGFSRAGNQGLARARGRYVLLLNPDTVLERDVLSRMVDYMDNHEDVGIVSCRLVTGDGALDLACRRSFPGLWDGFCRASGLSSLLPRSRVFARYNLTFLDQYETNDVEAVNGAFMFARRRAIDDVGFLDEDYFMYIEDLDWCYRFRARGWRIVYHPAATTLHLKGRSANPHSSVMIRHLFHSTEIFYRKHVFPQSGPVYRVAVLVALKLWRTATVLRNALRRRKRVRP